MKFVTSAEASSRFRGIALCSLLSTLFLLSTVTSDAALVAVDGFDDGNRTNSTDGINWYAINGFASDGITQKPGLSVADDAANLGSGNALFVDAIGSNSEVMGVFDSPITIPAGVGSKVVVRFDMRLEGTNNGGDLRFGMYNSNDPIGTGGFGTSDGDFDDNDPGVHGDVGTYVEIDNLGTFGNGDGARLREENNVNTALGGSGDTDYVAAPSSGTFSTLEDTGATNSIEFILERIGAGENPADFLYTVSLTHSGNTYSFSGSDGNDSVIGSTTSTYDYFIANTTSDTDWVLDNFSVESVAAVPEPTTLGFACVAGVFAFMRRRRVA